MSFLLNIVWGTNVRYCKIYDTLVSIVLSREVRYIYKIETYVQDGLDAAVQLCSCAFELPCLALLVPAQLVHVSSLKNRHELAV